MKSLAYLALILLPLVAGQSARHSVAGVSMFGGATDTVIRTYGVKINVEDMEKALAFYIGKLGFEIEDRSGHPHRVVLKSSGRNRLILNRVKKLKRPGPKETKLSFTLQVNDLDQSIARLKALGVEFGETEKRKEGVGNAIYIKDPFGRLISLMHVTIVKVEPFAEPKLYNFGFLIPDMTVGRDFYTNKLGFVVWTEKYLPLDLPLGHTDKSFAFMLHYRQGVSATDNEQTDAAPYNTLVFETNDLTAAVGELKMRGVKFVNEQPQSSAQGSYVTFTDPFGNVSELLAATK